MSLNCHNLLVLLRKRKNNFKFLPILAPIRCRGPKARPSFWCAQCTGRPTARRGPAFQRRSSCSWVRWARDRSGWGPWHTRSGGSGWSGLPGIPTLSIGISRAGWSSHPTAKRWGGSDSCCKWSRCKPGSQGFSKPIQIQLTSTDFTQKSVSSKSLNNS